MEDKTQQVHPQKTKPFFKKHSRWFAFLGTVIVLVTFGVNDIFRDDAKDLSDSVDRVHQTFVVRSDLAHVDQLLQSAIEGATWSLRKPSRLDQVSRESLKRAIRNSEESGKYDPMTVRNWHRDRDAMLLWSHGTPLLERQKVRYQASVELFLRLPYDKTLDDNRWRVSKGLALQERTIREAEKADILGVNVEQWDLHKTAFLQDLKLVTTTNGGARPTVDSFGEAVDKRAEISEKDADARALFWKRVGYVLYPLGAILGFIGKLYGEDVGAGE